MKPTRPQLALGLAALAVAVAGFFGGRLLKPEPTAGYAFDTDALAYEITMPKPGLSKGGFSGFGETAGLPGATLLSGKVASITPTEVVIEAADGTKSSLRLANPGGVRRIEAASRDALRPGASVVVLHENGSDEADAVLVVEAP
jgi:hypothetical protein